MMDRQRSADASSLRLAVSSPVLHVGLLVWLLCFIGWLILFSFDRRQAMPHVEGILAGL